MSKKNIAILFGGMSSEHEVSLRSAVFFLRNIPKDKYKPIPIGITKKGEWFLYTGPIENIEDRSWENDPNNRPIWLNPAPCFHGFFFAEKGEFVLTKVDAVIPVLHGKNGEDGTIQGLLTLSGIPYVGCNILTSAICMDKVMTNILLSYASIDQAKFSWVLAKDFIKSPEECIEKIEREVGSYPVFVKPANAGSSVGISKVRKREELSKAIAVASKEDYKILIEESITGQEVECAVLGNDEPITSIVGEIAPPDGFYDYEAKYINNTTKLYIPAHISTETSEKIRELSAKAYRLMGCRGLCRIDFFVEKNTGRILLNELNTFPGFASISMYPMLMDRVGIPPAQLIDNLITLALNKDGNTDE